MQQEVMPKPSYCRDTVTGRRFYRVTNLLAVSGPRPPHSAIVLATPDHTVHVALSLADVVHLHDLLAGILHRDRFLLPAVSESVRTAELNRRHR